MNTQLLFFLLFLSMQALGISPPPYYYQKQLKASVGAVSCITVDEPKPITGSKAMNIIVHACSEENARGLAALLKPKWEPYVTVEVQDPLGKTVSPSTISTIDELENNVALSFNNSPFFSRSIRIPNPHQPPFPLPDLVIEWQKAVVQFWSDDIGDYYGRTNLVASVAFKNILNDKFSNGLEIGFTTK